MEICKASSLRGSHEQGWMDNLAPSEERKETVTEMVGLGLLLEFVLSFQSLTEQMVEMMKTESCLNIQQKKAPRYRPRLSMATWL